MLTCTHKLTGLCGSLGLPTLCPGCALRRRSSHNPLRLSCSISCKKENGRGDLIEEMVHKEMLYSSTPGHGSDFSANYH